MHSLRSVLHAFAAALILVGVTACSQSGPTVTSTLEQPVRAPAAANEGPTDLTANALADDSTPSANQGLADGQTVFGAPTGEQSVALSTDAIAILPLEGAPQTAMTSLSRSLKDRAVRHGLNLQVDSRTSANYRVKGYFSALSDGSGTLLVYVWDVLDRSGNRVHRINGQERSSTNRSDPWLAISDEDLGRVADRTAAGLKAWVDTRRS